MLFVLSKLLLIAKPRNNFVTNLRKEKPSTGGAVCTATLQPAAFISFRCRSFPCLHSSIICSAAAAMCDRFLIRFRFRCPAFQLMKLLRKRELECTYVDHLAYHLPNKSVLTAVLSPPRLDNTKSDSPEAVWYGK